MAEYISASPRSWTGITTKKALKAKCTPHTEFCLHLADRDTTGSLAELPAGTKLSVTNHPKRTWFATVELIDGKVKVK